MLKEWFEQIFAVYFWLLFSDDVFGFVHQMEFKTSIKFQDTNSALWSWSFGASKIWVVWV